MTGASPSDRLDSMRQSSLNPGDLISIKELRESGRRTARERITALLDPNSFVEVDAFVQHRSGDHNMHLFKPLGDGVVAGHGMMDGRRIVCFAQDYSIFGGTMGEMHARKIKKVAEFAEKSQLPLIGIWDGDGQRAHEGVPSLGATGELLDILVACSGRIPIISLILGAVSGVSALAAVLSDFVILSAEHGQMFMRSPYFIPEIINGEIDQETLGGAQSHASRSGVACLIADDEDDAIDITAEILAYLPDHTLAEPLNIKSGDEWDRSCDKLTNLVPSDSNRPYDMVKVIEEIVDEGRFLEFFPTFAENILIGFARLDGQSVGIVANQPKVLAGCLDIDASVKAARFIRTCDIFNIPVITLVDVPGFLPGTVQEWGGIIRHGAKLLYAYAEATVPKLTVVTRKAYGGAYLAMSCKHLRSDYNIAWPGGELAVMGADGAVNIIHRREIAAADDKVSVQAELVEKYRAKFGDPYVAARNGWLDDVVEPAETRKKLIQALRPLRSKRQWVPPKKHGNIPL
ncbi:MAG: acyl-CoA carboxylase subunit beta [Euryarchaeota archaeon]|jgi:acetyl-CoA carboxylase carboxyltransferase component|nr:acyl-CoA carboxylase subunit beta [Euryarchaeota archaeon]MBT5508466.1 acyl-CoA carboxylase subunit beta [Euryarchaeota archaeon]MBT6803191.1 acyl-CoA carboxylase subunit beta [Euryarchaeota archaeon]